MSARKRWEYMALLLADSSEHDIVFDDAIADLLSEYGADGWEVVAVARNNLTAHSALMKREIVDE